MKFTIDDGETGTLKVRVGNIKEEIEFSGIDLDKLYMWYPMNICYVYRYQEPRDRLYLYPVKNPPENIDYEYEERLRTKPAEVVIENIGSEMMCENVMKDNVELAIIADGLGLPHLLKYGYTLEETKQGIRRLLAMLDDVKQTLEDRIEGDKLKEYREMPLLERENVLYSYATEEELEEMKQFGKLYTMINLMRKIAKEREGQGNKLVNKKLETKFYTKS